MACFFFVRHERLPPSSPKPVAGEASLHHNNDISAEIIHMIIDYLPREEYPDYDRDYRKTLSSCSLVCRSWLPCFRYYLFKSFSLKSRPSLHIRGRYLALNVFLYASETIRAIHFPRDPKIPLSVKRHIRDLKIGDNLGCAGHSVPRTLSGCSNLQSLTLIKVYFPGFPVKAASIPLLPTLQSLKLEFIRFPNDRYLAHLLCRFPNLTDLNIMEIRPFPAHSFHGMMDFPPLSGRLTVNPMDVDAVKYLIALPISFKYISFNPRSWPSSIFIEDAKYGFQLFNRILELCGSKLEVLDCFRDPSVFRLRNGSSLVDLEPHERLNLEHNTSLWNLVLPAATNSDILWILLSIRSNSIQRLYIRFEHGDILPSFWEVLDNCLSQPSFDSLLRIEMRFNFFTESISGLNATEKRDFAAQLVNLPRIAMRGVVVVSVRLNGWEEFLDIW